MRGNWTPERLALLAQLWNDGDSIRTIGRKLGITHNAVVGKVHRLKLPGREAPPPFRRLHEPVPMPEPDFSLCVWPIGQPGTKEFHWCGRKPQFGRKLCFQHQAEAFTRQRVGEPLPLLPTAPSDRRVAMGEH